MIDMKNRHLFLFLAQHKENRVHQLNHFGHHHEPCDTESLHQCWIHGEIHLDARHEGAKVKSHCVVLFGEKKIRIEWKDYSSHAATINPHKLYAQFFFLKNIFRTYVSEIWVPLLPFGGVFLLFNWFSLGKLW